MVIEGHDVRARSTDGSLSLAPCHDSQVAVGPVLDDDIFISSLGEALSSILITSAGSADVVRSPAGTVQQRPVAQPWVHDSLDPENLIQRALHERDPLLYIPYVPCRRRRAKTSPDLASVIKNLRKNPRYVTWKISGSALKELPQRRSVISPTLRLLSEWPHSSMSLCRSGSPYRENHH